MNKKKLLAVFMLIISYLIVGALAWRGGGEFVANKLTREAAANPQLMQCLIAAFPDAYPDRASRP